MDNQFFSFKYYNKVHSGVEFRLVGDVFIMCKCNGSRFRTKLQNILSLEGVLKVVLATECYLYVSSEGEELHARPAQDAD